jgi:nucleoside-triphosphatase THEP1
MKPSPLSPKILVISGWRGVGKTTLCQRVAVEARAAGRDTAGLVSPARFIAGEKTGIEVEDLRSGQRKLLASRLPDELQGTRLGLWTFDDEVFAWCNQALHSSIPCDILMIDELGPLEFDFGQGWVKGFQVLCSQLYHLAIVVIRPEYTGRFLECWPDAIVSSISNHGEADALAASLTEKFKLNKSPDHDT